uniref:Uncharacterized protein n=1 Tax=Onchocerca volvulus TaxID=6282 RepID=A0A8R1XYI2_ONCVO
MHIDLSALCPLPSRTAHLSRLSSFLLLYGINGSRAELSSLLLSTVRLMFSGVNLRRGRFPKTGFLGQ